MCQIISVSNCLWTVAISSFKNSCIVSADLGVSMYLFFVQWGAKVAFYCEEQQSDFDSRVILRLQRMLTNLRPALLSPWIMCMSSVFPQGKGGKYSFTRVLNHPGGPFIKHHLKPERGPHLVFFSHFFTHSLSPLSLSRGEPSFSPCCANSKLLTF